MSMLIRLAFLPIGPPSAVYCYGVVPLKVKMILRVCYAAKLNLVVTFNYYLFFENSVKPIRLTQYLLCRKWDGSNDPDFSAIVSTMGLLPFHPFQMLPS